MIGTGPLERIACEGGVDGIVRTVSPEHKPNDDVGGTAE
jgi:hypothetical protein